MRIIPIAFSLIAASVLSGCAVLIPFIEERQTASRPTMLEPVAVAAPLTTNDVALLPVASTEAPGLTSGMNNSYVLSPKLARSEVLFSSLVRQLKVGNAAERTCAATDLGRLKNRRKDVLPLLIMTLRSDDSKWVRRAAVKSLGRMGTDEVIAPLTRALSDRDKWVAHSAANALQRLKGNTVIASL